MVDEERQLLLQDLCGRFPYDVKVDVNGNTQSLVGLLDELVSAGYDINDFDDYALEDVKPYLRPMSSITEDEFYELKELGVSLPSTFEEYYGQMQYYSGGGEWGIIDVEIEDIIKYMNYLNSHHLDYRGLIPMGLALPATEDMYK